MKKLITILLFILVATSAGIAQVGVGTPLPDSSAQLDVVANDKGMLIPRVSLQSSTDATTIANGNVVSLMVYNTATVLDDIRPGYYYWDGSMWQRVTNVDDFTTLVIDANLDATEDAWSSNTVDELVEVATLSDGDTPRPEGTEVVIGDNGRVGIGTSTPTRKFHVQRVTGGPGARFSSPEAGDNYIEFHDSSANARTGYIGFANNIMTMTNETDGGAAIAFKGTGTRGIKIFPGNGGENAYYRYNSVTNYARLGIYGNSIDNDFITMSLEGAMPCVGIGVTPVPTNVLHVTAETDPLRLEGLIGGVANNNRILTVTEEGVVKRATATGAVKVPSGTSAQRPAPAGQFGLIRYNSTIGRGEMYVNDVNGDGVQGDAGWRPI